jgi:hypothetical protein
MRRDGEDELDLAGIAGETGAATHSAIIKGRDAGAKRPGLSVVPHLECCTVSTGFSSWLDRAPRIELPKYATDHEGQENHHGGQEQSGNNPLPQSNAVSGSRPARLTTQIEFRRPQFPLGPRGGDKQPNYAEN